MEKKVENINIILVQNLLKYICCFKPLITKNIELNFVKNDIVESYICVIKLL